MSVSNNRMSSEFNSELSSTMSSASLLPGNSESSAKDLENPTDQKEKKKTLIRPWVHDCVRLSLIKLRLTSRSPPPPLREYPAFQSLGCEPQFQSDPGPVSGDRLLVREALLAWAHTALTGGRTWQMSERKSTTRRDINVLERWISPYVVHPTLLSLKQYH